MAPCAAALASPSFEPAPEWDIAPVGVQIPAPRALPDETLPPMPSPRRPQPPRRSIRIGDRCWIVRLPHGTDLAALAKDPVGLRARLDAWMDDPDAPWPVTRCPGRAAEPRRPDSDPRQAPSSTDAGRGRP